MGVTQSSGTEHNLYWNLGNMLGNKFEDAIFEVLRTEFKARLSKDIKLIHTPRKNDGGRDIEIKFSCKSLNLFGITFFRLEEKEATIYIECKSSNSPHALRREKFISSIERGSLDKINYYVLLTNSKILPIDYYKAETLLDGRKIKFVLIDQYLTARFLKGKNNNPFAKIPLKNVQEDFFVQYQVYSNDLDNKRYDIYFCFRNYSKYSRLYTISLLTDVNWCTKENSFSFSLDANCACSKKICLVCDYESEYKTLVFKIQSGKYESFVDIKGIDIKESYIPPFTGRLHNKILSCILDNIISTKSERLFCLWGEAGIGKTRIIDELRKKLAGSYFDIYECILVRDNVVTIQEIQDFLIAKNYISNKVKSLYSKDLYKTIINSQKTSGIALIIIDDFHNSYPEFIEQIKKLYCHSAPVILILCGRTDYTEGSTKYYSFVHWTFENLKIGKNVWNVKPFQANETKRFIRAMIKGIPKEALNTIYRQSNNNPLYIVQFIEYMLDERLAYIVNRNTVGIVNPVTFQLHDYLPNEISDIYRKRIEYLMKISNENRQDYLKFLFVLAFYNGKISVNTAECYFDNECTVTSFLVKKKFILRHKNHYVFYHESLMLYVRNILFTTEQYKIDVSNCLLGLPDSFRRTLPAYMNGRLYLWNRNIEKALEFFQPIINSIKEIRNISNINMDSSTYEYFGDILQIFNRKPEFSSLAKSAINGRIYITLHHFVPINAVSECDKCISFINNSTVLKEDKKLIHSLLVQKAHALLNSGMNLEGELVLKELQSQWLVSEKDFDSKSLFDMIDRLCAIYIKFNCYDMAYNYGNLGLNIAKKSDDNSLFIIAYRTRSKLFYLNNPKECQYSLDKVDEILETVSFPRIQLNNDIYRAIFDLTYNTPNDYNKIINRVESLANTASKQNLNRASIQSNMVLAAAYLKRGTLEDIRTAKIKVNSAINYSIRFGIPSYMWQLYNLLAIIDTKLGNHSDQIKKSFETSFNILDMQNLLYIGRGDLCYSNILAISNIGFFLRQNSFQKTFNSRFSMITYCETSDSRTVKDINKQLTKTELTEIYEKAKKKELLFSLADSTRLLRDEDTGYFIPLT